MGKQVPFSSRFAGTSEPLKLAGHHHWFNQQTAKSPIQLRSDRLTSFGANTKSPKPLHIVSDATNWTEPISLGRVLTTREFLLRLMQDRLLEPRK